MKNQKKAHIKIDRYDSNVAPLFGGEVSESLCEPCVAIATYDAVDDGAKIDFGSRGERQR